jgi:hypothetical protein
MEIEWSGAAISRPDQTVEISGPFHSNENSDPSGSSISDVSQRAHNEQIFIDSASRYSNAHRHLRRSNRRDRPWSCGQPAAAAASLSRRSQLGCAVSEAAGLPIKLTQSLLRSVTRVPTRRPQLQSDRLPTARIRRRLVQRLQPQPSPSPTSPPLLSAVIRSNGRNGATSTSVKADCRACCRARTRSAAAA